jgi:hypothetical protein
VKALINWKLAHMPTYDEVDIHPLVVDGGEDGNIRERFLSEGELSTQGVEYKDYEDLD